MIKKLLLLMLLIPTLVLAQPTGPPLIVKDEDATPTCYLPWEVKFTNSSVTCNADGTASVDVTAGGITDHGALGGLGDSADHAWAVLIDGTRAFTGNQSFGDFSITNVGDIAVDSISADATDISLLNDTWFGDNLKLGFGNTAATPDVLIGYITGGNKDFDIDLTNTTNKTGMNIATDNDANLFNIGVGIGAGDIQDNISIGRLASGGAKLAVKASGNYTEAFSLVNTTNIGIASVANYASAFLQTTTLDNEGFVGSGIYRVQLLSNFFEGSGSGMDLNVLMGQIQIKSITGATTFDTVVGTTMLLSLNSAQTNTITTYDGYLSEAGSVAGGGKIDGTDFTHFRANNFPDYGGTIANVYGMYIAEQTRGSTINNEIFIGGGGEIFYRDQAIHTGSLTDGHYDITADGTVDQNAGQIHKITEVTTVTYSILVNDFHISIQYSNTGTHTSTLPAIGAGNHGQTHHIKDADYNASGNSITVDTTGSDTIEEAATAVIVNDGASISVIANNTTKNWEIQ